MIRLFRPPLNQRVPWSGTTERRAAVTVGARKSSTHTGTVTRQSAATNGGSRSRLGRDPQPALGCLSIMRNDS
jgi:hypothetical protein